MPIITKPAVPTTGDVWGNQLNQHLEQLIPDDGGGINKFETIICQFIFLL